MTDDRRSESDRRTSRIAVRLPDRRSGFDRRADRGILTWYRNRPAVIGVVLAAIVVFNGADYFLTVVALDRGAHEANPIMKALFDHHYAAAGIFKLGTASVVVGIIWRLRRYRRILGVSLIAAGGFGVLLVYQVSLVLALG